MNGSADGEWIASLVARYEGPLTVYAARFLGDVDRARDVVQDAFLKLWQADRSAVEDHAAKWLYTVCRNRSLDVLRKEQRMTTLSDGRIERTAEPPAPLPFEGAAGPRRGDERAEAVGGALALVAGLPPRQQEAVRLKFQGGLSYREMAEVMDTTVNNVGVLLHTAIRTVRERLAEISGERGSGAAGSLPGECEVTR